MHPQPGPPPQLSPRAKVTINLEKLAQRFEGSRDWPVDAEKTLRLETALGVLVQCMTGADELAVYTDDLIEKVETSNKALEPSHRRLSRSQAAGEKVLRRAVFRTTLAFFLSAEASPNSS